MEKRITKRDYFSKLIEIVEGAYVDNSAEIVDFLNNSLGGGYTTEDVQPMYDQIVEIPTNMSMYYLSYSKFMDMHDYAKAELGLYFNEVEFNKTILDCGAAPLDIVQERVFEYVENLKFMLNIE